jgi:hypothetical protein
VFEARKRRRTASKKSSRRTKVLERSHSSASSTVIKGSNNNDSDEEALKKNSSSDTLASQSSTRDVDEHGDETVELHPAAHIHQAAKAVPQTQAESIATSLTRINYHSNAVLARSSESGHERAVRGFDAEEKASRLRDDKLLSMTQNPRDGGVVTPWNKPGGGTAADGDREDDVDHTLTRANMDMLANEQNLKIPENPSGWNSPMGGGKRKQTTHKGFSIDSTGMALSEASRNPQSGSVTSSTPAIQVEGVEEEDETATESSHDDSPPSPD